MPRDPYRVLRDLTPRPLLRSASRSLKGRGLEPFLRAAPPFREGYDKYSQNRRPQGRSLPAFQLQQG